MEHATIIQLGSYPETTGIVESATFEEAFGEHSNLFGKKARARRAKRRESRRSDKLARKQAKRDFKAAKRTDRREARLANVTERTEMRKARRGQRATARQETRDDRKRGRQERRISRRADRKRQRQDMRDEQQSRRMQRKRNRFDIRDERKARRVARKAIGDDQGYDDQGYDDQGYGLGYDDQGYDDQGYGLGYDDQAALPSGDDYGYDQGYDDYGYDQGYDDQGYDQGWGDDYGYDQVGAANPYTSGSYGGGSPYADLGYEEEILPEFDTAYGSEYDDYYDEQPNYDYGYEDDYNYGNDFGQDFYFDGGNKEDEGLFISETEEIPLDADVLDRAIKIEWNKELISKLKEKGKDAAETGAPEKTGILKALKNRLERLGDLEAEESEFSNANGRNQKMVRKAKGLALGKRMRANPRFKSKMLAKLKANRAGTETYKCCCEGFAGGGDSTVPCDQIEGFGVCKSCGGLSQRGIAGRGMSIKANRPTVVSRGMGAQMSPQRIVVPAEKSSGMSGTNALDWENRTSPTGDELPLEVVELSSNASGKLKAGAKKINWLWVGVGVAVAAGTIYALHKYKVIK